VAAKNLVLNWDFETGDLTSWNSWQDVSVVPNNQHGGNYAVTINGTGSVYQNIAVNPSTSYTLSCWGKVASSGQSVNLGVKNHGAAETAIPLTNTIYTQQSLSFTTGANATTAQIYLYSPNSTSQAWGDDFELKVNTTSAKRIDNKKIEQSSLSIGALKVYPNPAKNSITLNITELAQVDIYSITGSLVKSVMYDLKSIDISDLQSGMYFLKVHSNENNITTIDKFIKL